MDGGKIMQKYKRVYREPIYFSYKELNCYNDLHGRICIEIKNKEDMEEKKIQHYDCFFNRKPSKPNLKPFDLEAAKAGKPVCTRDGRRARIICADAKSEYPVIALVERGEGTEAVISYRLDGRRGDNCLEASDDLMMLTEKKEGWVNVYKNQIHDTLESAEEGHKGTTDYIKTIKVSWEE